LIEKLAKFDEVITWHNLSKMHLNTQVSG